MQLHQSRSNIVALNHRTSPTSLDDMGLLRLIAQGDKSAMHSLFTRHRLRIYRFLLRLTSNRETAEELTSEVFLEVWRGAGKYQARSQVSTWLLAISRHLAWSTMRRRQTDQLDAGFADQLEDMSDSPEIAFQKKQQGAIVAHCLTKLTPAHREVIDLVYYHERTINEVSEIVGIPVATVKTRMHYARKEIGTLLERFGINRPKLTTSSYRSNRRASFRNMETDVGDDVVAR